MNVEKIFVESLKIINKLKIQTVLWGGVNLSLTRDKGFFDHEDNIDFIILRKNLNKNNIKMLKKNFKEKKYFELKRKNKLVFKKNNIRVKFCILDQNSKYKNYYIHDNYIKFLKIFIDKRSDKFFKKNKYFIPMKNKQYLSFHYDDWEKKPKFLNDSSSYTSHRLYVREKEEYIYKIYRIFINNIKNILQIN